VSQHRLLCPSCRRLSFDGVSRVNAVETLYSAFPAVMYTDPGLGAPLLEPLLRLQASSNHSIQYAAADLGMFRLNTKSETFRVTHLTTYCRIELPQRHRHNFWPQPRSRTSVPPHIGFVQTDLSFPESGNMLIMTYAHARATGDGSLISRYVCRDSNVN